MNVTPWFAQFLADALAFVITLCLIFLVLAGTVALVRWMF